MTQYSIGQGVTQIEAKRLLTGEGRYASDVDLPRQTYAHFLRSPHAHADIVRIDLRTARQLPGVVAILTGEDYAADGLGEITGPTPLKRRNGTQAFRPPRPALTQGFVRHIGQAVAIVIAQTKDQAKDAAERIEIDYVPRPTTVDTASANRPGTPGLWSACSDNEASYGETGDAAAAATAFAKAAHVVRGTFPIGRVAACTIEPRGVVADYDRGRDHLTIYACHQRPYVWRTLLAQNVFHVPEHTISLVAGDVGGSYGMKGGLYPEVVLVAWAAKKLGRPVKWICERSEAFIADDQGRDVVIEAELALDEAGRFLAMRSASTANLGAYVSWLGFTTAENIARNMQGPYTTPALHGRSTGVLTNSLPVSNYRAPAGVPMVYVIERLVDMAARAMNIDPAELRRRNLIPSSAMPYRSALGGSYDCGEFDAVLAKCLSLAGYAGVPARKGEAHARGKLRGVGVSFTVDPSANPSPEMAELRFDPGGTLTVLVGSTAGGQSHETIYAQIVSGRLGIEVESMRVVEGDTRQLSWGTGTGNSRTATIAGTSIHLAADKIVAKGKRIAAHLLEAAVADIEFVDHAFRIAGTDRALSFADVAKAAFQPAKLPKDIEIGLYETATWSPEARNVPNSAQVCEIEIDPETGTIELLSYSEVHDVGVELNPRLVEGQVVGGIVQSVGEALMEHIVYDQNGQLLTGSFMDYAMPRASDLCAFKSASHPVPTKTNPLGVKGAGECGTVGALGCIMNAVNDALAPVGIKHIDMPCTPERIWRAIKDARS